MKHNRNYHFFHYFIDIQPENAVNNKTTKQKGGDIVANNSSNRSSGAFSNMKYEVANEIGVTLNKEYNGNLPSRDAGRIGGTIVKKVFADYRNNHTQQ